MQGCDEQTRVPFGEPCGLYSSVWDEERGTVVKNSTQKALVLPDSGLMACAMSLWSRLRERVGLRSLPVPGDLGSTSRAVGAVSLPVELLAPDYSVLEPTSAILSPEQFTTVRMGPQERRCGTSVWLQHRVHLSKLWVLCSEKAACGCAQEDTALGLDCCRTLVPVWPVSFHEVTFCSQERKELWLDTILRQRSRAQEVQVTTLPSIHLLVNILGPSRSPVTLTAQTIKALVQCPAKSIPHHCSQSPRHGEVHRRALAEQQVQEQLEPKVPEPEDGRAHADVQTELCLDEPGDHGIKVEMVCQADVHLEQPPSLLCSLAEGGGAMARQAEGGEEPCEGRHTPPLQAQEEPSAKTAAWAFTEQVLAELFDSSLHIVWESNSNDPTERGSEDNFSSSRSKGSVLAPGVHASASGSTRSSFSHNTLLDWKTQQKMF